MKSKQIVIAVLAVGALASLIIAINYSNKTSQVAENSSPTVLEQSAAKVIGTPIAVVKPVATSNTNKPAAKEDYRYLDERLNAMRERRPNMNFDPSEVAAAIQRDRAWKTLKEIPKELPLKPEEFTDGREFISLDSLKIETLMPGDRMHIPIKGTGREYEVVIDNIEKHDYNSISWNGHIEGSDNQHYNATFTRGATLTVGGMDTPEGQYELQAHGNNGWIASSGLLFKDHVDPIDPKTITSGETQPHDHSTHTHTH